MQITAEYLMALKEQAAQEQRRLLAQFHQAAGAIVTIDALLARLKEAAADSD